MRRIAIIGSTGQLGNALVQVLQRASDYHICPLDHSDIECADFESVSQALREVLPDVVINCAAFVKVDAAEEQPDEAFQVNATGAFNVARACADLNSLCIHVSTDFVFDGQKETPYTEDDATGPINVYGTTKLAGEQLVRQACPKSLIVRVAALFGKVGGSEQRRNFVDAILSQAAARRSLSVVDDSWCSPTYALDAAHGIEQLIREDAIGYYHLANSGHCTWFSFAKEAIDLCGLDVRLEPVPSSAYPSRATRPRNSALISSRTSPEIRLRTWPEGLRDYLAAIGRL